MHDLIEKRKKDLLKRRRTIIGQPPEKALDLILDAPQPAALVHSFPAEDLYFLIHDIGAEDAMPVLHLASDRQWEFIVDLEAWQEDRIELNAVTRWLNLLLQADSHRMIRWLLEQQTEFLKYYLFRNIQVVVREHDQDSSDFEEGFFTFDDIYYLRILPLPDADPGAAEDMPSDETATEAPGTISQKQRQQFLINFLERIAAHDHIKYQQLLNEAAGILPAEVEEESYRLRNVRLAERGFSPFEEAIGIYQPMQPSDLAKQGRKRLSGQADPETAPMPVPLVPISLLEGESLLTRSLALIDSNPVLLRLQTEFAGLCNQLIAADRKPVRTRENLRNIVQKTSGYVSIGLERLTRSEELRPDARLNRAEAVKLIQTHPLSHFFKIGYGLALNLKWEADKWRKQSWFERAGLDLSFWTEEWLGVLGGLLIKRPLFFNNYQKGGRLYREFETLGEIKATEAVFKQIVAFDNLMALLKPDLNRLRSAFLKHKNLVLTLWARDHLQQRRPADGRAIDLPLSINEFRRFFDDLFGGASKRGNGSGRRIPQVMKDAFLTWLSDATGNEPYTISDELRQALEDIFGEIETELGTVAAKDLDPRYIQLFLVKRS